jgi:hypothetical protein
MSAESGELTVEIPPCFDPFVDSALLRIRALYGGHRFNRTAGGIRVCSLAGSIDPAVEQAVLHAVYREKIYADTLEMRRALVAALTRR